MTGLMQIGGRIASVGGGLASYETETPPPSGDNTATFRNVSGSTVTDYPLRFGRIFAEGEIADYPQILVDDTPITTQADVKTRWDDDSVKHCIMSAVIASAADDTDLELTFQNQESPNTTALTKSEMMHADFDFDAVISMTVGGVTHTASARDMLDADDYTVWCSGPTATTIILCDHISSTYDLTWSSVKFRPIFHATFWNASKTVDVSCIGELSNAGALGDLSVTTLGITTGDASPASVYTKSSFTMWLGTRWIKRFWIGASAPENEINFDHNLTYLKDTLAFPNLDTSLELTETYLAELNTTWSGKSKDIYQAGWWNPLMPDAAGRHEIGPLPQWHAAWLHTGDWRMEEISRKQADLAGTWNLHYRELGSSTKRLRRSESAASGLGAGLPISLTDRETTCFIVDDLSIGDVGDKVVIVGSFGNSGWDADAEHQPDPFSTPYALTGDYFYLEQMHFWVSATAHRPNGGAYDAHYGRGPTGAEGGGLFGEPRGWGWMMRNRGLAWFWTPDGDPYKAYIEDLIDDGLSHFEGRYGVTGGAYESNAVYDWAYAFEYPDRPNVLHFMEKNSGLMPSNEEIGGAQCPWMVAYAIISIGILKDLGFTNADTVLEWLALYLNTMVVDTDIVNPFICRVYEQGTGPTPRDSAGAYFQNWGDVYDATPAGEQAYSVLVDYNEDSQLISKYGFILTCASAYTAGYTDGTAARAWFVTEGYDEVTATAKQYGFMWCILPRT
jgi:hypothetical protein